MTKEIDLSSVVNKAKVSSSESKVEGKKEGSSLFDSILSGAQDKSVVKKESTTSDSKLSSKSEKQDSVTSAVEKTTGNETTEVQKKTKVVSSEDKKEKTEDTVSKKPQGSGSLLDRMLVEARATAKTVKSVETVLDKKNEPVKDAGTKNAKVIKEEDFNQDKKNLADLKTAEKDISDSSDKSEKIDKSPKTESESKTEEISEEKTEVKKSTTTKSISSETKINSQDLGINDKQVDELVPQKTKKDIGSSTLTKKETTISNTKHIDNTLSKQTLASSLKEEVKTVETPNVKETELSESTVKNKIDVKPTINDNLKVTNTLKEENPVTQDKSAPLKSEATVSSLASKDTKIADTPKQAPVVEVKNEKVAEELSKLNNQSKETLSSAPIKKEILVENKTQPAIKKEETSLLDKLIQQAQSKPEVNAEPLAQAKAAKPNDQMLTNMYLSSQRKNINDTSLEAVHQGKEIAKNASGVEDIKKSAKVMDLNLQNVKAEVKSQEDNESNKQILDKLAFNKNVANVDLQKMHESSESLKSQTTPQTAAKSTISTETIIPITVSVSAAQAIETRIIGAKQQMTKMMSDVAREMYQNYKPPVTAFRINLLPSHLGSIAIMMKSDKENSISISLNVTNSSTLDAMSDSQNSLRSALTKNFGEDTSFSLDFGMQDGNSNAQEQASENENKKNSRHASSDILATRNALLEEESVAEVNNYM